MKLFGIGSSEKKSSVPKALPGKVFKKYRRLHKPGQWISVKCLSGNEINGTIVEFDSDSITINENGSIGIVQSNEIATIVLHNPDSKQPNTTSSGDSSESGNTTSSGTKTNPSTVSFEESEDDAQIDGESHEALLTGWFPDRGYGFLWDNKKKKSMFFRRHNILDARVLTSLDEGGRRQRVYYSVIKPSGKEGKYDLVQIEEMISDSGFKQDTSVEHKVAALPTGNSLYDKAKRADLHGQIDLAESLYAQLISLKTDPKYLTAIMDLASLQNRYDSNKAVETLKSHRAEFSDERKLVVDRATVQYLFRAQRYLEAAELLKATMDAMEQRKELDEPTRRAYTAQLNQCYSYANHTELIQNEEGETNVGEKKDFIEASLFFPEQLLANRDAGFSYLLHLATTADYSNLGIDVKSFDDFPDSAVDLKTLQSKIESKRRAVMIPEDRSQYSINEFASYHDQCRKFQLALGSINLLLYANGVQTAKVRNGIRQSWSRFFLNDVQCKLFAGSLSQMLVSFGWLCRLNKPGFFWVQKAARLVYMAANCVDETAIIQLASTHVQQETLARFSELPEGNQQFPISSFVNWLKQYDLLPCVSDLFEEFGNHDDTSAIDDNSYSDYRETLLKIAPRIKESVFLSGKNIDLLKETVLSLAGKMPDDQEVSRQSEILLGLAQGYVGEVDALKKKRILDSFREQYEAALIRYVVQNPSLYSTEILFPILAACLDALSSDMDRLASLPVDIELTHLDGPSYSVENGDVVLRLVLKSLSVKSPPILQITTSLAVQPDSEEFALDYFEGPLVGGGPAHEFSLPVSLSTEELRNRAGTAKLSIKYQTILGQTRQLLADVPFTLLTSTQFETIPNPYASWSTGIAMTGEFFVGRQPLLNEIEEVFTHGTGGRCYVLYGQTRSGKTSVKKNLLAGLDPEVYVAADMGEDYSTVANGDPFVRISNRLIRKLSSYREGVDSIPEDLPQERILQVCENVKATGKRVVVAIDEFTRLYEEACRSKELRLRVRTFLRGIKGLLGEEAFHLIILGQESMVQLRDSFPNEFAVTKFKRLSYLSKEDSRTLAEKPILNHGESRYRGNAFERLFALTAGYPYYMHIFCDRLVQYLNENHLPIVEEAQINTVECTLCSGDNQLSRGFFESFTRLYLPSISNESIAAFYYTVANKSQETGWCSLENVRPLENGIELARILGERGILEQVDDKIRIRMGLFASWLRANPDALPAEDPE